MEEQIRKLTETFDWHLAANALTVSAAIVLIAALANWVAKKVVVRLVAKAVERTKLKGETAIVTRLVAHLSNVIPALIIGEGAELVPNLPDRVVSLVASLSAAFIIFTLARVVCDILDLLNAAYEERPDAASRPIKGYVQVAKIVVYAAGAILIVAQLSGQPPLLILSGLGAMAAVLLLIFRDTILSLVASVQLRSNDMVRVGDWIEMPQLNADGDVIDIALHTVKVQNFDKTVTTIPTHKLISESFRNWRFMREWGGRRIKRSIFIDKTTIGFLSDEQWRNARRFQVLRPYMERKEAELAEWNGKHAADTGEPVNRRRPTNLGTFRAYVMAYLQAHPRVAQHGTLLVRTLDPSERGIPLEVYCFADSPVWAEYEGIQSDIFEHLLAILPEFGLRAFQNPSGADFARRFDDAPGLAAAED